MRRLIVLVVAVAAVVAAATGCASAPSQAASAAIVGATGIPLSTAQDRIATLLGDTERLDAFTAQGGKPSDVARDVVSRAVVHVLTTEAARRQGITIAPGQIDANLAAEQQLGAERLETPESARERVYDALVTAELARRELDGLVVTLDVAPASSEAEAEQLAGQAARGDPAADQTYDAVGSRGLQLRAAEVAASDPAAAFAIPFGTPAGRVVYYQPNPGSGGWLVLRVTDRRSAPAPTTPTPQSVAAALDQGSLQLIGLRLLQPLAEELGVQVNPRYGVWDPLRMRVVTDAEATGHVLVVTAPR